jgi:DNA-directed RNA polymerase specialized sigma24 family protein
MGICLRYAYTRTDASEIVNDSFMKVFRSIGSFDEQLPVKPWMRKITVNTAIDDMNKTIFGYLAATGLDIPLTEKLHILAEIAYRIDLTPAMTDVTPAYIWKSTNDFYSTQRDVRNRMASLTLGVTYTLD